jgi:hypothetical protein
MRVSDYEHPIGFAGNVSQHRAYWRPILRHIYLVELMEDANNANPLEYDTQRLQLEEQAKLNLNDCSSANHPDFDQID